MVPALEKIQQDDEQDQDVNIEQIEAEVVPTSTKIKRAFTVISALVAIGVTDHYYSKLNYQNNQPQTVYSVPLSKLELENLLPDKKYTQVIYDSPELGRRIPLVTNKVAIKRSYFGLGEKKVKFYINDDQSQWFISGARWLQGKDPVKLPIKLNTARMSLGGRKTISQD